jgi:hypothetical protein
MARRQGGFTEAGVSTVNPRGSIHPSCHGLKEYDEPRLVVPFFRGVRPTSLPP